VYAFVCQLFDTAEISFPQFETRQKYMTDGLVSGFVRPFETQFQEVWTVAGYGEETFVADLSGFRKVQGLETAEEGAEGEE